MMVFGNIMRENLRSGTKYSIEGGECIEKAYMKGVVNEWPSRFRGQFLII